MNTTLFKEVGYALSTLISDIEMGEIGLPDIQRPFVWKNSKVRDLFDSMFRGYPVGYLLFWENQVGENTRQIGDHNHQKIPHLLIVDGQQLGIVRRHRMIAHVADMGPFCRQKQYLGFRESIMPA